MQRLGSVLGKTRPGTPDLIGFLGRLHIYLAGNMLVDSNSWRYRSPTEAAKAGLGPDEFRFPAHQNTVTSLNSGAP